MSDANPNGEPEAEQSPEAKMPIGDGLQAGLGAIQQVFEGIVNAAKNAIGPEVLRNLQAAGWLKQVAECLDALAAGLRATAEYPPEKAGELACHVERLEVEVKESKFEVQLTSFRQRLDGVLKSLEQAEGAGAVAAAKKIGEAAGYFHAAAKTVTAPIAGEMKSKTITITN